MEALAFSGGLPPKPLRNALRKAEAIQTDRREKLLETYRMAARFATLHAMNRRDKTPEAREEALEETATDFETNSTALEKRFKRARAAWKRESPYVMGLSGVSWPTRQEAERRMKEMGLW